MNPVISTKQICDTLQVSRNWVNDWLRPMGGAVPGRRDRANVRTIFYYREDILRWLNQNARYSRQTQLVDLARYADPVDIDAMLDDVESVPDLTSDGRRLRRDIYHDFLRGCLPPELYAKAEQVNSRCRGQLPWVQVNHHIGQLEQLRTMRQLMEEWGHRSQEMTYRAIYERGMIRVEIMGRTWFMPAPEGDLEYPLLLPAKAD